MIPVYNDWESVQCLLPLIDREVSSVQMDIEVLLINDGSSLEPPKLWKFDLLNLPTVRILNLTRNLGHQRAICIALCHLLEETDCDYALVMDADGEDAPSDIPRLLKKMEENTSVRVVFAERMKRSEGWLFSCFYHLYRVLHLLLSGLRVRVGNFSVIDRKCMASLCSSSELWNHYAASAFATKQSMDFVPTHRATRLMGESKMNFTSLVMHGLSALSVFRTVSTRVC